MSAYPTAIRVLAVDDHPLVRGGITALLANTPDIELVAEASTGREAIEMFDLHRPDVTLMDIQMPDMSGIDAIIAIRARIPAARFIVLTTYRGDVLAHRAMRAGAQAYLLKSQVRKDLVDTIRAVFEGERRIDTDVAMQIAQHSTDETLTLREVAVLEKMASGNSNKLIARELDIADGTVKTHVKSILSKLHAQDRTHAVTLGIQRGIIELDDD